jgi:hypothetical protein
VPDHARRPLDATDVRHDAGLAEVVAFIERREWLQA